MCAVIAITDLPFEDYILASQNTCIFPSSLFQDQQHFESCTTFLPNNLAFDNQEYTPFRELEMVNAFGICEDLMNEYSLNSNRGNEIFSDHRRNNGTV